MKSNESTAPTTSTRQGNTAPPFFSKEGDTPAPFFAPQPVQPKLQVGAPDDIYERQADAVADEVARIPAGPPPAIQTKAAPGDLEEKLQKKGRGEAAAGPVSDGFASRLDASKGGGSPMPAAVSESMGNAIGADFSGVRIHTDSTAATLSRSISAQAFTSGSDIYFNEGKYNPDTTAGRHLLAHELTHTVQQRGSVQRRTIQRKPDISMAPGATIQRGILDWGGWPWNWGGATEPTTPDPDAKVLKKVKSSGQAPGANFDSSVSVPSPSPAQGDMTVTMRININFQNTDLKFITDNILSTDTANLKIWKKAIDKIQKEDPAKLKWTEPEKEKVRKDYQKNIDDVWPSDKTKLTFKLNDPDYEKYEVKNNFKLEFTDKNPHHKFSVVKMVDGPTLRSYMGGTPGGFHDSRTFGGTSFHGNNHNMLSEQLGDFDNDSAVVTPGINSQITKMVGNITKIKEAHKADSPPPVWNLNLTGRANSTGDKTHNLKLSQRRADAVEAEVSKTIGSDVSITTGTDAQGNAVAGSDTKFRRVEAVFSNTNGPDLNQVTMAHETGHMFGYGDEYGDVETGGVLPKYSGDEADGTSKAIRDAGMGEDVVKQHRIENNSESIMNAGNVVGVGHYSLFLIQLRNIATDETTNAPVNWQVVKG